MTQRVVARAERWPIAGEFRIARGAKTTADVVVVEISDGRRTGRGECLPYPRYGETVTQTLREIAELETPVDRRALLERMPPGAARNGVDCALWDLEAKQTGTPVWRLAGLEAPAPVTTAFTIGIGPPDEMRAKAQAEAQRPLLKIKLGGDDAGNDVARLAAVRAGAPAAELIVDANEGWSLAFLREIAPAAADFGVAMIEQPLPAAEDDALLDYASPVSIGADESVHADTDLEALARKYSVVNIKLDKTGGLTRAIGLKREAEAAGLEIMIGCMVATSLSMAPALLLAQDARFVDLDGPLLLDADRDPGLTYRGSEVSFPAQPFWGV